MGKDFKLTTTGKTARTIERILQYLYQVLISLLRDYIILSVMLNSIIRNKGSLDPYRQYLVFRVLSFQIKEMSC